MLLLLHFYVYFQLRLISSCDPRTYCIFSCRCCAQNVKFSKLGKWKWDFLLFAKNRVILIFSLDQLILIFSLIFSLCTMRNTGTALRLLKDNNFQQKEKLDREILNNLYNSCKPQVFSIFLLISLLHFCVFLSLPRTHTPQLSHCNKQIWEFPKTINSLFWKILKQKSYNWECSVICIMFCCANHGLKDRVRCLLPSSKLHAGVQDKASSAGFSLRVILFGVSPPTPALHINGHSLPLAGEKSRANSNLSNHKIVVPFFVFTFLLPLFFLSAEHLITTNWLICYLGKY